MPTGSHVNLRTGISRTILARLTIAFAGLVLLSLSFSFLLDSSLCFVGRCLTKHSAYRAICVGMKSFEADELLQRAGIFSAQNMAFASIRSNTIMFSDFWRDYLIQIDPKSGLVIQKTFHFRFHGEGIFMLFRLLRN